MSNLLILESENDKFFIEALVKYLNLDIELGKPICNIDEYECIGGISRLSERLKALTTKILKGDIDKIGIIFDADKVGIEDRKKQIQIEIEKLKENLDDDFNNIEFKIFILNKNGFGELETVLKHIKSKDSTIADCLNAWQKCLPNSEKLNQKEFDKFWIQIYQRYDCCSKREKKRAGEKCNNEISFTKDIYDLDNVILEDLKIFLRELG